MAKTKKAKSTGDNALSNVLAQAGLPQKSNDLVSPSRTNEITSSVDCIEDNRWAQKNQEPFDVYLARFLSQAGPAIDTIVELLKDLQERRGELIEPNGKRLKSSPAKGEDDDVIVIDDKPHLEAWKAYFRAHDFAKNPFAETADIKRSVTTFLMKLDQAKREGLDPISLLFGGLNASADLKRNVFAALQSEGELNLDKFLSHAKHEADQTRSTIINKKGFKKGPKFIEDLEAEDWSKEDLEKIRDRVEKKVKAFLLADFEEPRQDLDGMFPNLYALVALTFSKGPVSTATKKPLWRSIRNPIRVAFDKHFPSSGMQVDNERNDQLLISCFQSFSRVAQAFSDELSFLSPSFEKNVGEWMVLGFFLLSILEEIPELEEFKNSISKWISTLYEQALRGATLHLSSLDPSEILSARWVLSKKDFRKSTRSSIREHDKVLAKMCREKLVIFEDKKNPELPWTLRMIWQFFCKDLGFSCGSGSKENDLEHSFKFFENNFEERFEELAGDESYLTCPQSASNLWTYAFWLTHYAFVKAEYSRQTMDISKGLGKALYDTCLRLARMPANTQAPDCLGELLHAALLACPENHHEISLMIPGLLRLEDNGVLVVEKEIDECRRVLHGRFVYLLALSTFIAVHRSFTAE